ncbi:hypothetical protein M427DRAFT_140048 [Gonapodya prolifera JEL478]|uniref:Uncharacterized protein n=1 Tax=Gonapodya prolifera (strain JEL478) TaxID=1344416 RepID=A0A139A0D8_GONPJ|nr:hypothetical protein M427DRAFT_140048 [Gonapodya prolifera JEL478]|eukprot:KXS10098.1 hypothetical protein M427DRAFT_140048 [Gonapodya prolifera JEL478]
MNSVHIPPASLARAPPTTIHLLPCRINYDGPTEVKRFLVVERVDGDEGEKVEERKLAIEGGKDGASAASGEGAQEGSPAGKDGGSAKQDGKDSHEGTLETVFRGRLLKGRKVKVPVGYKGFVLYDSPARPTQPSPSRRRARDDSQMDETDDTAPAKQHLALRTFDGIVVWGHDEAPGMLTDPYARVGDWCELARKLHEHVDPGAVGQ